jgi:hypothetical protein
MHDDEAKHNIFKLNLNLSLHVKDLKIDREIMPIQRCEWLRAFHCSITKINNVKVLIE